MAKLISLNIKEQGRMVRNDDGDWICPKCEKPVNVKKKKCTHCNEGTPQYAPVKNTLKNVKAIGWVIPEYNWLNLPKP